MSDLHTAQGIDRLENHLQRLEGKVLELAKAVRCLAQWDPTAIEETLDRLIMDLEADFIWWPIPKKNSGGNF